MDVYYGKFQERLEVGRDILFAMSGLFIIAFFILMLIVASPYKDYEQKQFIYKTVDSVKYQPQIKDLQTKMDVIIKKETPAMAIFCMSITFWTFGVIISIILFVYNGIMEWRQCNRAKR